MYLSLREGRKTEGPAGGSGRVAGTVLLLGLVSLLTDVSSESVAAVLPLYLTGALGLSPLAYGFVDGVYQGASAVVRILGGWLADRGDHPKWVAVGGYGLSALTRLALLAVSGFAAVTAVVTVDRLGKGLRTAPRDAMIMAASDDATLGRAFGTHRALDTVGAAIGPLLAFVVLWQLPDSYHSVFVVSFAFAVVGLAVLVLAVPDLRPRRSRARGPASTPTPAPRPSLRLLRDPRLARLLLAAAVLGLLTVGDGFLYLSLQQRDDLATAWFPLLYVGTNLAYLALAIPLGRLGDRVGRAKVFLLGHVALLASYLAAAGPVGGATTLLCLLLLGTYYAATDGILAALSGRLTHPDVRASGIATAQTVQALARFASSLLFGLLWFTLGRTPALLVVAAALLVALLALGRLVLRLDRGGAAPVATP
ncbi:MFS transporter [Angustibacter luteus]|uniref:MFS transporter n=1 Tax=Angustibacter luteus TaxID=658456 RepID=A0ABW1JIZ8_9ACTN